MNIKLFFQLLTGIFGVMSLLAGLVKPDDEDAPKRVGLGLILVICCLALIY